MVPLCRLTWYRCVVWHGTVVSFDMVPLCHVTWYRCINWYGTVFSQLFKMCGFLCTSTAVVCWLYSSAKPSSTPVLSSTSRTAHPREMFPVLFSSCIVPFLCFYVQNMSRIRRAYCMEQCVLLSDLQGLLLTLRWLMSYIYGAPILDISRSHTTTQHSRLLCVI